jgi:hypothetical protein
MTLPMMPSLPLLTLPPWTHPLRHLQPLSWPLVCLHRRWLLVCPLLIPRSLDDSPPRTEDRIAIYQFHHHHRKPRFAAQLETPDGTVTLSLVPGKGPAITDVVAPTIPGPASYKAAMATPAWREWLTAIHAEVAGQAAAGCWHWALLPPVLLFSETSSSSPKSFMPILPLIA